MGQGKAKSRSRAAILRNEPRCIFCSGAPETLEHMPSRGMLRDKQRPSGMEYASCSACNNGTGGADAVAALLARMRPESYEDPERAEEIRDLVHAVDKFAPGVRQELMRPDKADRVWVRRRGSGIFQQSVRVNADGPMVRAHLVAYGAKLAMALYREHVGTALPTDGTTWCQFALNAGTTQQQLDARVEMLPIEGTLRQGKFNVRDQFVYRYNTDERTVVAAVIQFHKGLWFTVMASSDPEIAEQFNRREMTSLAGSGVVKPGGLLGLLSSVQVNVAGQSSVSELSDQPPVTPSLESEIFERPAEA